MWVHLFNPLLVIGYVGQHQPIPKGQLCQKYSAYGLAGIQPVLPVAGCQYSISCNTPGTLVLSVVMLWVLVSWLFFYCSDTYKAEWEISVNFHVSKINLHCFFKIVFQRVSPLDRIFFGTEFHIASISVHYAAAPKQIQGKLGRRRECRIVSEWKCFSLFERQKGYFLQSPPSTSCVVLFVYCKLQLRAV